jgi:hypothetical protein
MVGSAPAGIEHQYIKIDQSTGLRNKEVFPEHCMRSRLIFSLCHHWQSIFNKVLERVSAAYNVEPFFTHPRYCDLSMDQLAFLYSTLRLLERMHSGTVSFFKY